MTNLEFVRIDDRLIHGQVVAAWLHAYGKVSQILVVDDKTSKDQFMLDMFKMLVPSGITIEIKSIDEGVGILKGGLKKPTMMIVKEPLTLKKMADQGIKFDKINIGGMGMTTGRKKLFQNVSANDAERQIFKEFIAAGTTVEVQIIPASKTVNVATLVK
jgi:PTS system mannose-specific IIB component